MKIPIKVTPRAKQATIVADGDGYRVKVTVAAVDGKANAAALKLLAKYLKVAPSRLKIVRGAKSRDKLIELTP